ncbi:MAG: hypothetical protein HZB91_13715 [Elusimicrobia bacterium]|nr:hypothetical protein [Elusimicrobiota bacterium]
MRYWVFKDSRLVGPLGADEMAQVGGLRPETLVCVGEVPGEKEGDWKCAEQIPELAGSCQPDLPSAFVDAPETMVFDSLMELAESGGREDALEQGLSFYEFLENSPIADSSSELMGDVTRQQELLRAQAKARDLRAEVDALARRVRELEVQRNELMDRLAGVPQVPPALPPASIAPPVVVAPEPAAVPPLPEIPELPPLPVPGVSGGKEPPSPEAGAVLRSPEGAGAGVPAMQAPLVVEPPSVAGSALPQAPEAAPAQDSRASDMALPALEPLPPAQAAPLPAPGVAGAGVPPPPETGSGLPAPGVAGAGVPPPLDMGSGQPETVSAPPPAPAPAADTPASQKALSSAFPDAPIGAAGLKFKPTKTFKKKGAASAPAPSAASPAAQGPASPAPQAPASPAPQALPTPAPEGPGPLPPLPVLGAPPAAQPQAKLEEPSLPAASPWTSESSALDGAVQYPEKPFSFPVAPSGPPAGAVAPPIQEPPASSPPAVFNFPGMSGSPSPGGSDSQPAAGPSPAPFSFPAVKDSPLPSSPETTPLPQPGDAPQIPFGFSREQPGPMTPPPIPQPQPQPPLTLVRDVAPQAPAGEPFRAPAGEPFRAPAPFVPTMPIPELGFPGSRPVTPAPGPGAGAMPWAGSSVPPPATLAYSPAASSLPVAPGPRPLPTPVPTPLEPEAMTGGRELLSRLAKPADTASTAPKPKRRRPTWMWIVACAAVLAAVVGIWVVFFQDPKDLKVMFKAGKGDVPVEPESEEGPGPDAASVEPGGGSAPTGGTAPAADIPPGGAAAAGSSPMPDPGKDAVELAKAYPLGGGRGTILAWMQYSFPSSPGDGSKEEWTAGAMDSSTYFVQYKFTPGPGSAALRDPVQYLFEVSLAAKTVVGKNPAAKELLAGKAQPARKPAASKLGKPAAPKKKPKPAARPVPEEQPAPQPLPNEEDLLPPSDEGAMPATDTVE